jgi:hypothetical protein
MRQFHGARQAPGNYPAEENLWQPNNTYTYDIFNRDRAGFSFLEINCYLCVLILRSRRRIFKYRRMSSVDKKEQPKEVKLRQRFDYRFLIIPLNRSSQGISTQWPGGQKKWNAICSFAMNHFKPEPRRKRAEFRHTFVTHL